MNLPTTDAAKILTKAFFEGRERTVREFATKERALYHHGSMMAQLVSPTILRFSFLGRESQDAKADRLNGILYSAGAKYHLEGRILCDHVTHGTELLASMAWHIIMLPAPVTQTEDQPAPVAQPPPVIVTQSHDEMGRAVEILSRFSRIELEDLRDTPF